MICSGTVQPQNLSSLSDIKRSGENCQHVAMEYGKKQRNGYNAFDIESQHIFHVFLCLNMLCINVIHPFISKLYIAQVKIHVGLPTQ